MNNDFNKMVLEEVRGLRNDMSEVREDLAYLKGSLGQPRDEKKELAKTSGVAGLISMLMLAIYEFVTKLKS